jgi:hypothetical protein
MEIKMKLHNFLLVLFPLLLFLGCGKRTDANSEYSIASDVAFSSLAEFEEYVNSADLEIDVANLHDLEKYYVPTAIPEDCILYKIVGYAGNVWFYYLPQEYMSTTDKIMSAEAKRLGYIFIFTRWNLESPLSDYEQQKHSTKYDHIDNKYLIDTEYNEICWEQDGEALMLQLPKTINVKDIVYSEICKADTVYVNKSEKPIELSISKDSLKLSSLEELKSAKGKAAEAGDDSILNELEYFYIPDIVSTQTQAKLRSINIKDRNISLFYDLTDIYYTQIEDTDENVIFEMTNTITFKWERDISGRYLLNNAIESYQLVLLGGDRIYYKDISYPKESGEILVRNIYWVNDGYYFRLSIPIKLYNDLFIKDGKSEISAEDLELLTSLSRVDLD